MAQASQRKGPRLLLAARRSRYADSLASRKEIVRVFEAALAPYIGATMAGASLRGHCEKLGIGEADVSEAQVEALISAITPGLHVFVGEQKTLEVVQEIRVPLRSMRPPS
jgi:hypothetical protein